MLCDPAGDVGTGRRPGWRSYKKRLNKNQHRSILLTRGGDAWIFEYLFAKKDRGNIRIDELIQFRRLAKSYETLTAQQIEKLLAANLWKEICHGEA